MLFEIKNSLDGSIIFKLETTSIKLCVEAAIKSRADLSGADLSGADLSRADLSWANLSRADLSRADLSRADLSGADLSGANLSRADLSRADLSGANMSGVKGLSDLQISRTQICPQEGAFVGWKKLSGGIIARLVIPHDAERINSYSSRKCRSSKAVVHELFGADEAYDKYSRKLLYKTGCEVIPDKFDPDKSIECSHGIHFFITREEAEDY